VALGFGYWSLSAYLKDKVKGAVSYISAFEVAVAAEARRRGADGVICGHIHKAEIRDIDGVLYCNDGDWVESCTALVEHWDGRLEILTWADQPALQPARVA
jgi:UDP-2,3-diacylglucosamine pyrophosphatase LpxH